MCILQNAILGLKKYQLAICNTQFGVGNAKVPANIPE